MSDRVFLGAENECNICYYYNPVTGYCRGEKTNVRPYDCCCHFRLDDHLKVAAEKATVIDSLLSVKKNPWTEWGLEKLGVRR